MRISVDTADGLVDSLIEFNVFDTPAEKVELVIDGVDAAGLHWRSRGTHRLGDDGRIDLTDPDLPWWDMRLVDNPNCPDIFESCDGHWISLSRYPTVRPATRPRSLVRGDASTRWNSDEATDGSYRSTVRSQLTTLCRESSCSPGRWSPGR